MENSNKDYKHKKLEAYWQKVWSKENCFKLAGNKKPYYVLEMFPYPSGRIHMGHVRVYTLGDVLARYKRAQGYDVMHPMGWDSFGMPAENAAMENNIHPRKWTEQNIKNMKTQLKSMGISYDWTREISTCNKDYIKQQQKLFIKLYNAKLAYRKKAWANWDPVENTVLANEQVIDGKGWRSGVEVEKKLLDQWFLAITNFAEPLLNDLDNLKEWPENVKIMQKNWIGKSEGAYLNFTIIKNDLLINSFKTIDVFSTRPDTIFGASFIAIAPDHKLSEALKKKLPEVDKFIKKWEQSFTNEEMLEKAPKIGIFTGLFTQHPFLEKKLPVYIANFVLSTYGTGAIFGVPAHDQRDFEFAKNYALEIIQVVKPKEKHEEKELKKAYLDDGIIYNSSFLDGMSVKDAKKEAINRIVNKGIGKKDIRYRLRDWCASRQRYWGCPIPIIYREDGVTLPVEEDDLPIELPEDINFSMSGNPLNNHPTWKYTKCKKTGLKAIRETDTLDTFFDSSWYYLRFLSYDYDEPFNKIDTDKWSPVHQYVGGIEHAVLHLLYSRFFIKALNQIGEINITEPFKGLFCQGMVCHITFKDEDNKWVFPEDVIKNGSSFSHKLTGKKVNAIRSEKMSKSKKNIVDPVNIIKEYGADTARIFMLSDSPPERNLEWSTSGIEGAKRYILKIWLYFNNFVLHKKNIKDQNNSNYKDPLFIKLRQDLHCCIEKVTKNLDNFQYNVAVATLREFSNVFLAIKPQQIFNLEQYKSIKEALQSWVIMISPLMPHLAEELWKMLQNKDTLATNQPWPKANKKYTEKKDTTLVVQINGKKKVVLNLNKGLTKKETEKFVLKALDEKSLLKNKTIKKIIVIPDKIVNLVI